MQTAHSAMVERKSDESLRVCRCGDVRVVPFVHYCGINCIPASLPLSHWPVFMIPDETQRAATIGGTAGDRQIKGMGQHVAEYFGWDQVEIALCKSETSWIYGTRRQDHSNQRAWSCHRTCTRIKFTLANAYTHAHAHAYACKHPPCTHTCIHTRVLFADAIGDRWLAKVLTQTYACIHMHIHTPRHAVTYLGTCDTAAADKCKGPADGNRPSPICARQAKKA